MSKKVFVNRILNLKKIKMIGLDMDHTLIRYNTKNFEALVYRLVIEKLVTCKNYPQAIKNFTFNFNDTIRGLVIDSKNGNILKLSRYAAIRQSYHGTRPINYAEQQEIYRSIYVDLADPNYIVIDTSFSIAFCVIYGQLVDYCDEHPNKIPNYDEIAADVMNFVNVIHADGSLKKMISENLAEYVLKDSAVVAGLKRFIRHGKKIFILTNSEFYYTKMLLDYAINPFLAENEHWSSFFQFVIVFANKPRFFFDDLKFLKINPLDGTMTNIHGPIMPGIYQGGCAKKFTEDLVLRGDEILYIGDHIYGDIVRLKKHCNWRTALVVEELGDEIAAQLKALPTERQIAATMLIKKELEHRYFELTALKIDEQTKKYDDEVTKLQQEIAAIDFEISHLLQQQHQFYNPRWDRVFRAGAEESYFAYQVDRFACIYMEKLVDLLQCSPLNYFRANRRVLAHDVDLD